LGAVSSLSAGLLLSHSMRLFVNSSALVLWCQWCLGMVAAEAYVGITQLPGWSRSIWTVLTCAAAGTLCRHFDLSQSAYLAWIVPLLWGFAFFALTNRCIWKESLGKTGGRIGGALAGVGLFSYSLYLVHLPVRTSIKELLGSSVTRVGAGGFCICASIMAAAGLLVGSLFFRLIERRFLLSARSAPMARPATDIATSETATKAPFLVTIMTGAAAILAMTKRSKQPRWDVPAEVSKSLSGEGI